MKIYKVSIQGKERKIQQDSLYFQLSPPLFLIADGFGEDGATASQTAINVFREHWAKKEAIDAEELLQKAFSEANRALINRNALGEKKGKTTIVAAMIDGKNLYTLWAGDSRLYLIRGGKVCLLTSDHTRVRDKAKALSAQGENVPKELLEFKSPITRCLGEKEEIKPELLPRFILQPNDRIFLATDGFYGPLNETHITELLSKEEMKDPLPELIKRVGENPEDDATAILVVVEEPDLLKPVINEEALAISEVPEQSQPAQSGRIEGIVWAIKELASSFAKSLQRGIRKLISFLALELAILIVFFLCGLGLSILIGYIFPVTRDPIFFGGMQIPYCIAIAMGLISIVYLVLVHRRFR